MKYRLKAVFLLGALSIYVVSSAQDMQFTQFNAAPLYLNPAFTGSTIEHRVSTSYRNQWAGIPGGYTNYVLSYDYNMAEYNSGLGFLFAREQAGTGNLGNTEAAFLYSYHFRVNKSIFIQPGIKFNYVSRGVDFQKLIFNDQLANGGGLSSDDIELSSTSYLDVTSGVLLYSEKYWFGMAFNHMNQPNQSLTNNESPLYFKFSAHGGYKYELEGGDKRSTTRYLNLAFQYKSQQKFDQLDLGVYYSHNPLVFGIWYRGIPLFKSYEGVINNDAIALLVGYVIKEANLSIGYSYDATISRLASNSAGSHEISLIYEIASKKQKRKRRRDFVPCAKF
jgi:type IX secretion system PorP/SprF family membrane protein